MNSVKKLTFMAMFVSFMLVSHFFETVYIIFPFVPGVRLGFSNIFIILLIYFFGCKKAGPAVLCKVLLSFFIAGNPVSFILSLSATGVSFVAMSVLIRWCRAFSVIGISVISSVLNILTQLFFASLLMNNSAVWGYLPVVLVSSCIAGVFTGFCAMYMIKFIKKHIIDE